MLNDPRRVAAAAQLPARVAHARLQLGRVGEGSCRSLAWLLRAQPWRPEDGKGAHVPRPLLEPSLHLEGEHRHKDPLAFMQRRIWQKKGSFVFLRRMYTKYIWQEKGTPHSHTCTSTRSPGGLLQRDLFEQSSNLSHQ